MRVDLKNWCIRLESFTHGLPTSTRRKEVDEALRSKWEGVQVWAARVLASWGDRQSIDELRRWLESSLTKEAGWAVRGEAVNALCKCYKAEDIPWLLDMYFKTEDRLLRHELLPFVTALPHEVVRRRIKKELKSESELRQDSATIAKRRLEFWKKLEQQRSNTRIQPTAQRTRRG